MMIRLCATATVVLSFCGVGLLAENWPRFRGPNGQGISRATTVPTKITEDQFNWRVRLPGSGHGSPVVWGNRIFLVCAKKSAERLVVCLDAESGRQLWARAFDSQPHRMHKFNHYGASTPVVDAERVYLTWVTPKKITLMALDHDGKPVWQRQDLGGFKSQHGGGTSPMLYKDRVILTNDQLGPSYLLAVDAATGENRWKIQRRNDGRKTAYAVPCVYTGPDGKDQLVFMSSSNGVSGHDPATGKQLWAVPGAFDLRVVSSPVIAGGLIFGSCGRGGGGTQFVAVKPGDFQGRGASLAYEIKKRIPYVPTAVAHDGKLYIVSDSGIMMCLDPATGKTSWAGQRLDGSFFGSPVVAGGHIYLMSREGTLFVIKADPAAFRLIHKHDLGEMTYATPAVAGGRMYLRTKNHLISVGGK